MLQSLIIKKLCKSYWNDFLKRNKHLIKPKKQLNLKTKNQSGLSMEALDQEIYKISPLQGLSVNFLNQFGERKCRKG
jgi:hypothetical protein